MSEYQRISGAHLAAATSGLRQSSRGIQQILDELSLSLATLAGQWDGDSATAYQEAQARWNASLQSMNLILANFSNALEQSAEGYSDAQRQVTNLWT